MKTGRRVPWFVAVMLAAVMVLSPFAGIERAGAQAATDWDIPGGHFFTQTGTAGVAGYAIVDDVDARFWAEFQRLGGAEVVGYPVSGRFEWSGFTVQAFQRVVFQWRPEAGQVAFANVFDLMHDQGKDAWLQNVRQTPAPRQWQEDGLAWDQVVANRLKVMDAFPEIKKAYMGVKGDPITMNGLPTTDVVDMGNNYILRAQRVVIQQWKEDVPWAKKGQVTFGLGGQIAKEAGLLSNGPALSPLKVYFNQEKMFVLEHPATWAEEHPADCGGCDVEFTFGREGNIVASRLLVGTEANSRGYTPESHLQYVRSNEFRGWVGESYDNVAVGEPTRITVGGLPGVRVVYAGTFKNTQQRLKVVYVVVFSGNRAIYFWGASMESRFDRFEADLNYMISTLRSLK